MNFTEVAITWKTAENILADFYVRIFYLKVSFFRSIDTKSVKSKVKLRKISIYSIYYLKSNDMLRFYNNIYEMIIVEVRWTFEDEEMKCCILVIFEDNCRSLVFTTCINNWFSLLPELYLFGFIKKSHIS